MSAQLGYHNRSTPRIDFSVNPLTGQRELVQVAYGPGGKHTQDYVDFLALDLNLGTRTPGHAGVPRLRGTKGRHGRNVMDPVLGRTIIANAKLANGGPALEAMITKWEIYFSADTTDPTRPILPVPVPPIAPPTTLVYAASVPTSSALPPGVAEAVASFSSSKRQKAPGQRGGSIKETSVKCSTPGCDNIANTSGCSHPDEVCQTCCIKHFAATYVDGLGPRCSLSAHTARMRAYLGLPVVGKSGTQSVRPTQPLALLPPPPATFPPERNPYDAPPPPLFPDMPPSTQSLPASQAMPNVSSTQASQPLTSTQRVRARDVPSMISSTTDLTYTVDDDLYTATVNASQSVRPVRAIPEREITIKYFALGKTMYLRSFKHPASMFCFADAPPAIQARLGFTEKPDRELMVYDAGESEWRFCVISDSFVVSGDTTFLCREEDAEDFESHVHKLANPPSTSGAVAPRPPLKRVLSEEHIPASSVKRPRVASPRLDIASDSDDDEFPANPMLLSGLIRHPRISTPAPTPAPAASSTLPLAPQRPPPSTVDEAITRASEGLAVPNMWSKWPKYTVDNARCLQSWRRLRKQLKRDGEEMTFDEQLQRSFPGLGGGHQKGAWVTRRKIWLAASQELKIRYIMMGRDANATWLKFEKAAGKEPLIDLDPSSSDEENVVVKQEQEEIVISDDE